MNPWKPFPLIRLLIPFLGGVVYTLTSPNWQPDPIWLIGICCFLAGVLLLLILIRFHSFRFRWIPGLTVSLLLLSLGILTVQITTPVRKGNTHHKGNMIGLLTEEDTSRLATDRMQRVADWSEKRFAKSRTFIAEVIEPPRHTAKSVKLIVGYYVLDTITSTLLQRGKLLLYMEKDSNSMKLQFGNWVIVSATLKPVQNESNPYGFDPADYYSQKGVFNQGWVNSAGWRESHIRSRSSIRRLAFSFRDRLLNILRENKLDREEFSVASAILLGYTAEIDQDLRKGFAASGAMHILAVSGMHVGIIFLFLETMLAFLDKRVHGPALKGTIIILMIWSYAMITGLSPPVFRAALMLSMVILGRMFKRKPDSLNVVGGSMFVMLLMNPMLLMHIGFQFSYLAVFGILFLYKPIHGLIPGTGWLLSRIWGLAAVSLAAQLATFPLSLFAFHQFPNYFIITNLLILPLASLVIYVGIGVLVLSSFNLLSILVTKGLSFIVGLMNLIVRFVEGVPGSTTTGIYTSVPDTLLLYLLIIAACCFLMIRHKLWAFLVLIILILWSGFLLLEEYRKTGQRKIVVFQVKGTSQYVFVSGRRLVCIKDFRAACKTAYAQEVINTFREAEGISEFEVTYLADGRKVFSEMARDFGFLTRKGNFLQFHGKRIMVVSSPIPERLDETLHVDMVIIRMNPDITMERIVHLFHPRCIVIDPTNSRSRAWKWREQAKSTGVFCHVVAEEGAFIWDEQIPDIVITSR